MKSSPGHADNLACRSTPACEVNDLTATACVYMSTPLPPVIGGSGGEGLRVLIGCLPASVRVTMLDPRISKRNGREHINILLRVWTVAPSTSGTQQIPARTICIKNMMKCWTLLALFLSGGPLLPPLLPLGEEKMLPLLSDIPSPSHVVSIFFLRSLLRGVPCVFNSRHPRQPRELGSGYRGGEGVTG